jgi:ankyrin repeat protein
MKHLLLTTIAAVVLVGCGPSSSEVTIHEAAKKGDIRALKQHLDKGIDVNEKDKVFGKTPLHWMTYNPITSTKNNKKVAEMLIANGANLNTRDDNWGQTPLHMAVVRNLKEVCVILIEKGADINLLDVEGRTPLDTANYYGYVKDELKDLLHKNEAKTSEELEVKLIFNSDGTVSNLTHKLLARWTFNEVDNSKSSIKATAGLPLILRVNIEQARPNGKGGLAIPALNPNESLSVRLEHNDLGEKLFSEYVIGVKVKIISNLTSEFFSVFDTGQPHPDEFYSTADENLKYKGDAEIYVKHNEGIGILGDYVGSGKIINDEYNWFVLEVKEDSGFLVIDKYINGEHVGTQRESSLFGAKRYKLQTGKEAKPVSFFVDNDSETKPCIVSEIFLSVPDLLRKHGGKTGEELVMDESTEAVKKALSNGVDINAKIDGLHPLTFAVTVGNEEIVKLLIKEGGDVNAKDDHDGTTPLHSAANGGLKEIIELLIKKGANINTKNKHGETPLDSAINYTGHFSQLIADQIIDLLVKHGGKYETMHSAAAKGDLDELSDFLDSGLDVNAKNKNGATALHNVSSIEMAKLLIDKGANVNARDDTATTPLHNAAMGGHNEIVELLIAKGADVNSKGLGGVNTPLHNAIMKRHKEIVELLIANGADVNAKGFGGGGTPLNNAIIFRHKEIVELLIANGADVNARDNGNTLLDLANSLKQAETADLLRKHGGKTGEELKAEGK